MLAKIQSDVGIVDFLAPDHPLSARTEFFSSLHAHPCGSKLGCADAAMDKQWTVSTLRARAAAPCLGCLNRRLYARLRISWAFA